MNFQSVRAEKDTAMRRYDIQRNLKTFVRISTLFSLLVLCFSWSCPWIPAALDIAGEFFRTIKSVLYQRQYGFLLVNTLALAIYFSNHKNVDVAQPDLYDEYVSESAAANLHLPESETKIAVVNPNSSSPVGTRRSKLVVVTECSASVKCREIEVTETGRSYRRSQSESFERRTVAVRRELRRSETEMAVGRQSMEEMSSEEFRIIVESFIAKKKRDLKEEDIHNLVRSRSYSHPGVAEP
ncbi:hypothetical protein HS088_TW06G01314 [Tripterygium wilfordii]|uniref:Uncharacterized protein n=1 Tax=Tripterygium wilfordii TaxID=458696 RepID=A0A7J7DLG2_TRIWF|nr:uncharacterized protein LOC120001013 [Tripterygium wilfordii]KAF5747133.1 hypothetical protein HS088_TW06G01314 [Tripterygium wilfordii]